MRATNYAPDFPDPGPPAPPDPPPPPATGSPQLRFSVLSVPVDALNLPGAVARLRGYARSGTRGTVIFRDVHGIVRCQDDPAFLAVHHAALLVCPDGMPVVWLGRRAGFPAVGRVYGPDLMRALMAATRDGSATHFLYGGNPGVAARLQETLEAQFPGVRIVGTYTPPFGPLGDDDRRELQATVARLKPDFFWVGLSTPKQEFFMAEMLPQLDTTIMLGVGAAFDYLSGAVREPPAWLRRSGLQWLARICQEPRRLAGRYLRTIPRFLYLLARSALRPKP